MCRDYFVKCISYTPQYSTKCLQAEIFWLKFGYLVAIIGAAVLPTIILGVNVTTVTTFRTENVTSSNYIHNTRFNADIYVHYESQHLGLIPINS